MDSNGTSGASALGGFILILILIGMYWLPAIVAASRKHPQTVAISVLTLCLGWTLIGWVIALVWSFTSTERPVIQQHIVTTAPAPAATSPSPKSAADEIAEFARLKDIGAITSDEFEAKKTQLLGLPKTTSALEGTE